MSGETASLGAEAVQLLDAITDRLTAARQRFGGGTGGDEGSGADTDHVPDRRDGMGGDGDSRDRPPAEESSERLGAPASTGPGPCPECGHDPAKPQTCTGCPICTAQAMLRGERPEATAKLIDGALAVLQVLRGLVAGAGQPPARADQSGGAVSDEASDQAGSTGAAGPANGEDDAAAARAADGASRDGSVVRIDIR